MNAFNNLYALYGAEREPRIRLATRHLLTGTKFALFALLIGVSQLAGALPLKITEVAPYSRYSIPYMSPWGQPYFYQNTASNGFTNKFTQGIHVPNVYTGNVVEPFEINTAITLSDGRTFVPTGLTYDTFMDAGNSVYTSINGTLNGTAGAALIQASTDSTSASGYSYTALVDSQTPIDGHTISQFTLEGFQFVSGAVGRFAFTATDNNTYYYLYNSGTLTDLGAMFTGAAGDANAVATPVMITNDGNYHIVFYGTTLVNSVQVNKLWVFNFSPTTNAFSLIYEFTVGDTVTGLGGPVEGLTLFSPETQQNVSMTQPLDGDPYILLKVNFTDTRQRFAYVTYDVTSGTATPVYIETLSTETQTLDGLATDGSESTPVKITAADYSATGRLYFYATISGTNQQALWKVEPGGSPQMMARVGDAVANGAWLMNNISGMIVAGERAYLKMTVDPGSIGTTQALGIFYLDPTSLVQEVFTDQSYAGTAGDVTLSDGTISPVYAGGIYVEWARPTVSGSSSETVAVTVRKDTNTDAIWVLNQDSVIVNTADFTATSSEKKNILTDTPANASLATVAYSFTNTGQNNIVSWSVSIGFSEEVMNTVPIPAPYDVMCSYSTGTASDTTSGIYCHQDWSAISNASVYANGEGVSFPDLSVLTKPMHYSGDQLTVTYDFTANYEIGDPVTQQIQNTINISQLIGDLGVTLKSYRTDNMTAAFEFTNAGPDSAHITANFSAAADLSGDSTCTAVISATTGYTDGYNCVFDVPANSPVTYSFNLQSIQDGVSASITDYDVREASASAVTQASSSTSSGSSHSAGGGAFGLGYIFILMCLGFLRCLGVEDKRRPPG